MNNLQQFANREQFLRSLNRVTRDKMEAVFEDMDKGMDDRTLGSRYVAGCIRDLGVGLCANCSGTACRDCWTAGCTELRKHFGGNVCGKKIVVEFHLNGKATTALIKTDGKVTQRGVAKQHIDDKYNAGIGMLWALAKAINVEPIELIDVQELLNDLTAKELVTVLHSRVCH